MWIRQYCVSIHRNTDERQEETVGNKFIIFLFRFMNECFAIRTLKVEQNEMTMFSDKVVSFVLWLMKLCALQ